MGRLVSFFALVGLLFGHARHAAWSLVAPTVTWHHDTATASTAASAAKKPVLVFFGATWDCGTKEMERETFQDPEVRWLLRDFVVVDFDASDDELPEVRAELTRFKVLGLPTLLLLEPDMKTEIKRFNEYLPPEKLASALRAAR